MMFFVEPDLRIRQIVFSFLLVLMFISAFLTIIPTSFLHVYAAQPTIDATGYCWGTGQGVAGQTCGIGFSTGKEHLGDTIVAAIWSNGAGTTTASAIGSCGNTLTRVKSIYPFNSAFNQYSSFAGIYVGIVTTACSSESWSSLTMTSCSSISSCWVQSQVLSLYDVLAVSTSAAIDSSGVSAYNNFVFGSTGFMFLAAATGGCANGHYGYYGSRWTVQVQPYTASCDSGVLGLPGQLQAYQLGTSESCGPSLSTICSSVGCGTGFDASGTGCAGYGAGIILFGNQGFNSFQQPTGTVAFTTATTSTVLQGVNASLTPDSINTTQLLGHEYGGAIPTTIHTAYCYAGASATSVVIGAAHSCASSVFSLDFSGNVVKGDTLIVGASQVNPNTADLTISDTFSSSFTIIGSIAVGSGTTAGNLTLWYVLLGNSGADTITVTAGTSTLLSAWAQEVTHLTGSLGSDSTGSSTSGNCGCNVASMVLNEYTFSLMYTAVSGVGTWTATPSFNKLYTNAGNEYSVNAQSSSNATGTSTTPTSFSTSSGNTWAEITATFPTSSGIFGYSGGTGFNMTCGVGQIASISGQHVCSDTYLYMNIYPINQLGVADTVTFYINNTGIYPTNAKANPVQLDVLVWTGDSLQNLEQFTPTWYEYNVSGFQSANSSAQVTMLINTRNPCGGAFQGGSGGNQACSQQNIYPPSNEYSPAIDASIQPGYNWSINTPSPMRLAETGNQPGSGAKGTIGWVAIGFYVVDSVMAGPTSPTSFRMGIHTNHQLMLTQYSPNGSPIRSFYSSYLAGAWNESTPVPFNPNFIFPRTFYAGYKYEPPINWNQVINMSTPQFNFDIGLNFQIYNLPISSTTATVFVSASPTQYIQNCNGQQCTINNGLFLWLENDLPAISLLILLPVVAFAITFGSLEMIFMGLAMGIQFAQMAGYVPFWVIIVVIVVVAFQLVRQVAGSIVATFQGGAR